MPLLEGQIRNHNSITLPDPEMTRFFVTTAEAADSILSALPFAADLHVRPVHLSKGAPRKVMDFVNQVVDMTGKGVRTETNPFGVEIKFSGLRPGEKLHEKCACEGRCTPLAGNPDILVPIEPVRASVEHGLMMTNFRTALELYDETALRNLLVSDATEAEGDVLQTA